MPCSAVPRWLQAGQAQRSAAAWQCTCAGQCLAMGHVWRWLSTHGCITTRHAQLNGPTTVHAAGGAGVWRNAGCTPGRAFRASKLHLQCRNRSIPPSSRAWRLVRTRAAAARRPTAGSTRLVCGSSVARWRHTTPHAGPGRDHARADYTVTERGSAHLTPLQARGRCHRWLAAPLGAGRSERASACRPGTFPGHTQLRQVCILAH